MAEKTILIVDDNPVNMKLIRVLLAGEGYDVRTAADAQEALNILKELHPDLILMDIVMPRMTGLEACRVLKKDKDTEKIPVILLTTRGEEQYVQEGYASGCSDYLTKPVNDVELLDLLKAYLGE